jgi:RNA polymerase sigma-70 factor (ECF subfamily)
MQTPSWTIEVEYERHSQEVWALAYARLRDVEAAHDIKHETFLRLLDQRRRGNTIPDPRAWLMRVADNLVKDYLKSAPVRRRSKEFNPDDLDNIQSGEPSPLDTASIRERKTDFHAALAKMDIKLRTLLTLRHIEGLTLDQISAETGVPRVTVWKKIALALLQLREHLSYLQDDNGPGLAPAP